MHPQIRQPAPGSCPICGMALEPVTAGEDSWSQSRTDRHDAAVLDRRRSRRSRRHPGNGRARPEPEPPPLRLAAIIDLDPVSARHAGRAVGGLAILRPRLGVGAQPIAEHVQPDRARHRHRLSVQPRRDLRAWAVPGEFAARRRHSGLLRSRCRHHCACAARPGSGAARARADRRRHSRFAQSGAEDRAPYPQ